MFVRASVTQRLLMPFDNSRWVMILGAKIIDSFLDGTLDRKSEMYRRWIKLLEQNLYSPSEQGLTNTEVTHQLSSSMQVGFKLLNEQHIMTYAFSLGTDFVFQVKNHGFIQPLSTPSRHGPDFP